MTTKAKHKSIKKFKNPDDELATHTNDETRKLLEEITGGPMTLGKAIRCTRECDEISQADFAKKLGVSKSYLSDLENNRKTVSLKKAAEFARILEDSEKFFVLLALRDMFKRQGLHYEVDLRDAA